jgi:ABC-type phosphate/phosphonate transport system substrate-binding protein
MKTLISMVSVLVVMITLSACAGTAHNSNMNDASAPNNIDKNNVGITSGEAADQTDPSLIEGNLEDNDFKN